MLAETFVRVEGAFPLIGVGGIDSGATAIAKIRAGATWCSSIRRWCFAASALVMRSRPNWRRRCAAAGTTALTTLSAAMRRRMTAQPWPD